MMPKDKKALKVEESHVCAVPDGTWDPSLKVFLLITEALDKL